MPAAGHLLPAASRVVHAMDDQSRDKIDLAFENEQLLFLAKEEAQEDVAQLRSALGAVQVTSEFLCIHELPVTGRETLRVPFTHFTNFYVALGAFVRLNRQGRLEASEKERIQMTEDLNLIAQAFQNKEEVGIGCAPVRCWHCP